MRKKPWMAGLFFAAAFVAAVIGCSRIAEQTEADKPRIMGATYMSRNNPFFDVLHESIETVVAGNGDILEFPQFYPQSLSFSLHRYKQLSKNTQNIRNLHSF